MPVDVTTEITIARPVTEVAGFAMDPRNAPRWYVNIDTVEMLTDGPLAVGTLARFSARFLGRTLAYTYAVRTFVPERELSMSTEEGPFPMTTTYRFEATGEASTRMTLRNHGAPAGFGAIAAPVMAAAMRRANAKDCAALKALLESQGGDGTGR